MRLFIALALVLAWQGAASSQTTGSVEVGIQLVNTLGIRDAVEHDFKDSMSGIMNQLKQIGDEQLTKSVSDIADTFFKENYKWEKISVLYGNEYAKVLSDDEMKAAIAFYQTPAGKKLVEHNVAVQGAAAKATQTLLQLKLRDLQRSILGVVQKRQMEKNNESSKQSGKQ